jgi:hypothetical protein
MNRVRVLAFIGIGSLVILLYQHLFPDPRRPSPAVQAGPAGSFQSVFTTQDPFTCQVASAALGVFSVLLGGWRFWVLYLANTGALLEGQRRRLVGHGRLGFWPTLVIWSVVAFDGLWALVTLNSPFCR